MSDLEVRNLIVDDLFTIANMLMSITGESREEMANLLTESDSKSKNLKEKQKDKKKQTEAEKAEEEKLKLETGLRMAMIVLQACFNQAETKMKGWMASIIGKTAEEFGKMPISTPLKIIDKLQEKEDMKAFFSEAFALYKKMNGSAVASIKK